MRGGDHIEPRWVLRLPADATAPPQAQRPPSRPPVAAPKPPPAAGPSTGPDHSGDGATEPAATPSADRDAGVTGPVPSPAPVSPSGGSSQPAGAPTSGTGAAEPAPRGVSLPTGGWVDLGLAAAIAAAAALVWRHRARRYRRQPPSPRLRLDDPDLAPMPDVVTRVRRGLREPDRDEDTSLHNLLNPVGDAADADLDADTGAEPDAAPTQDLGVPATPPPLNVPALGNPMLAAWPPAGLGLTGPGAEAAGRGFLAAALASGGLDDPDARTWVVMPAATAARLLGAAAVNEPDTPRLTVAGGLAEALEILEEQTQYRTRMLYDNEVDTAERLREANPFQEPLPPIMLIAGAAGGHQRARMAALLVQGQRLDIHGVLLGAWPDGNTTVVAADGTTTPADGDAARHGAHPADVGRLAVLTPAETAELIATLAESHTGLPQPPPHVEAPRPRPAATPPDPPRMAPNDEKPVLASLSAASNGPQVPGAVGGASTSGELEGPQTARVADPTPLAAGHAATQASEEDEETAPPPAAHATAGDEPDLHDGTSDDDAADGPGLVAVQVLGRPTILGADPNDPLRAKAMELLVYLIARGGGATTDAMKEDLVPDATVSKAPHRIHTYIYALRKALRRTGGRATYVTHPPHRYLLNPDAFDIDLWRMRDALTDAETATGDHRVAALRRAIAVYTGPLAEGARYEWAEPYREAVRRQALNAYLALADALTDHGEAIAVLDAAISHDPYAEPPYQAAMRRHADLGDAEAIAGRLTDLTRRLDEIDTEPTDETAALAGQLREDVTHRARQGPRRDRGAAA